MNILYLCDEYPAGPHGGIGTAVQLLARQMVQLGHHVEVAGLYSPGYGEADYEVDHGVVVHRFREVLDHGIFRHRDRFALRVIHRLLTYSGIRHLSLKRSLPRYHRALNDLVRSRQIDLVVVPDYQDYMRFCIRPLPLPKFSVPQVVVLHGSKTFLSRMAGGKESSVVRRMEKEWIGQSQAIIAVSRFVEKASRGYFQWDPAIRTEVIPNGQVLDVGKRPFPEERDAHQVIFAGTLVEAKGIYSLMKAWNLVAKKRPQARLSIYGKGPIPKVRALLLPEYRKTVRFLGHVDRQNLAQVYAGASIGVFPSFLETFGIAAMEAMYAGLAVIYTQRTAGPELIEDQKTGLLIDPQNIDHLARSIIYLLDQPLEARRLGERAREKVIEDFEISQVAAKHEAFYKSLVSPDG